MKKTLLAVGLILVIGLTGCCSSKRLDNIEKTVNEINYNIKTYVM